jgi:hypothetical protein
VVKKYLETIQDKPSEDKKPRKFFGSNGKNGKKSEK